jgi:zinc and cadmium transporter
MGVIAYTLISVILISLVAVVAIIPVLMKKKLSKHFLLVLLSLSVGTLLGGVFIHFLPEMAEQGYTLGTAIYILLGFLVFFVIEKFVHYRHKKNCQHGNCGHGHAYHLAPLNLIGDGVHNFLDGMVIAGSYIVSIPLGIAATISILFHEVPQEIADFGVLLYSGMSKLKAVMFNLLSAATAIVGAVLGLFLAGKTANFTLFIIPFAAGSFLYIAASNLVPELHRHCKLWDTVLHLVAILVGVGIMVLVSLLAPVH